MRRSTVHAPHSLPEAMWTPAGTRTAEFIAETGEHVIGTPAIKTGWENVEALALKFLRGCYFSITSIALGTAHVAWARTFPDDPRELIARFQRVRGAVTLGDFPFQYVMAVDESSKRAGGFFVLWNFVTLFAANLPQATE